MSSSPPIFLRTPILLSPSPLPDTRVGVIGVGFPPELFPPPFDLIGVDGGGCHNFRVDDAGVLFATASLDREARAHYSCMAKSRLLGFPLRYARISDGMNDLTR